MIVGLFGSPDLSNKKEKSKKPKKPFYKRWWFIVIVVIFIIGTIGEEDDKVVIYGALDGVTTYTSVLSGKITVPSSFIYRLATYKYRL